MPSLFRTRGRTFELPELRSCVKIVVAVLGSVPNKPTFFVNVKQYSNKSELSKKSANKSLLICISVTLPMEEVKGRTAAKNVIFH